MADLLHHAVLILCGVVIALITAAGFVPNWSESSSVFSFSTASKYFSYALDDHRSWQKGPFRLCLTVNDTIISSVSGHRSLQDSMCGWLTDDDINSFREECLFEVAMNGTGSSSTMSNDCQTGYYQWMSVRGGMIGAVAAAAIALILLAVCYVPSITRSRLHAHIMMVAGGFIFLAVIGTGGTVGVWLAMTVSGSGSYDYGFYMACGGCVCAWFAFLLWCVHRCTASSQQKADQNMNRMADLNVNNNVNTLSYYPQPQPQPQPPPYYQQPQPQPQPQPLLATNNGYVAVELPPTTTWSSSSSSSSASASSSAAAATVNAALPTFATAGASLNENTVGSSSNDIESPAVMKNNVVVAAAQDDDCKEYNYDNPLKET